MNHMVDNTEFHRELEFARAIAVKAGRYIADHWNLPLKRQHKGSVDLVTEIDLGAEKIIVQALEDAFPSDTVVAEEGSSTTEAKERTWYVDPLDGTTTSHGLPHFAVSIGLLLNGKPAVGVIYEPIRDWCPLPEGRRVAQ